MLSKSKDMMIRFKELLFLCFCILVVQGCVSYSSPSLESDTSGRYTRADGLYGDAYDEVAPDVRISVADAAYYPWWSVDYYYLGRHYYRPAYWRAPRYSFGVPSNYWPYYGFYGPMYYPYATYAWYDPWYGWPRYGVGTNLFWHEINRVTRHRNQARPVQDIPGPGNNDVIVDNDIRSFTDAFYDSRDRGPVSPVVPARPSGSSDVFRRSISRPPSASVSRLPGLERHSRPPQSRPGMTSPGLRSPSAPATRPSLSPPPGANTSAGPAYKSGKRKKN